VTPSVPSQLGQSLVGSGIGRSSAEGTWTNSALFSTMASATRSAVIFSPLQNV